MNKRIISLLLCFVMVFGMLATAVPAYAKTGKTVDLTMTADKSEAYPGDTINYTVTLGAVEDLLGIKFKLLLPEGLTFVEGKEADGVKAALNATSAEFTPSTKVFLADPVYTSTQDLVLMTFSCTVDAEATGDKTVQMYIDDPDNWYDSDFDNIAVIVTNKTVAVTAKPVPVTSVTIDETLSVKTGESKTPGYTVNPAEATNKTVSFESNNPAVATVNATTGEVTGVKEGTATITITTADGNFTDTCVVTVDCSHANKTPVDAKASDCKNQGWDAYSECDDCGQLFAEDGTTEIAEIPFRSLDPNGHTGGTATCTAQAVCTRCGQSYGPLAAHSYTDAVEKAEALKSEGNCRDKAVYYYSCSACGKVEGDDGHTFFGMPNPDNHVGPTKLVGAKPADHKNQIDGYTGDTTCDTCGEVVAGGKGSVIPAGAHVESLTWTTDGTDHWKVCTFDVNGSPCGVEIDGTRATHYSDKAENKATCNAPAKCDACGVSYGQPLTHVPANKWENEDPSGHWHKCQNGCGEKLDFAQHTPDHQGGATEEYAIKCTICDYVIEPMLNHEHKFDVKNPTDNYKATDATCMKPATYYWACRCGEKSSDTYEHGSVDPDAHNWDSAWSGADNPDNHWHACLNGCGEKNDVTVHDYKMKFDSTKHWEECVCGRKINEGNHIDTDKNDVCDTCGSDMLKPGLGHFGHWDYNGDGRCDYCGVKTGCTHTDANGDGKCDNCSSTMKPIESVQTFDAGIVMYAGMAVLAATGSAVVIGKKRKEQ